MPDDFDDIIKALAHPLRRDILRWLKEPQRYFAAQHHSLENGVCAGQIDQRPCSSYPTSAAKQASESNAGQHSQSIEPSRPTSAAVSQSPISP